MAMRRPWPGRATGTVDLSRIGRLAYGRCMVTEEERARRLLDAQANAVKTARIRPPAAPKQALAEAAA